MKDRVKRKIAWENQGVSEIVGTILMLTITVVLFSTIITWVGRLPPPRESIYIDLEATLDPVNTSNWSDGVRLNIRHKGGQDMDGLFISLFITVDAVTLEKALDEGGIDVADDEWSVGETWSLLITTIGADAVPSLKGPLPASVFKILIINNEKNAIIWTHTLGEADNHYTPIILDAWIDSDLGTVVDDPGPISYTEPFKFYARIVDPEGYDPLYGLNLNEMWVNLSWIGLSDHVNLTDVVDEVDHPEYSGRDALHDNVYVAICEAPAITVNPGYYYFWVHAEDLTQPTAKYVDRPVLFPVGMIVGDNPQIIVKTITFSDEEPVNGDTITIYANIWNQGLAGVEVDVKFYDVTKGKQLINTVNISTSVEALGESTAQVSWKATPGGVHTIGVNATVLTPNKVDPFLDDNYLEVNMTVMPKILLVDDDNAVNDQSSTDTVSFMRASMEAADFAYDFTVVGAGDGPGYDYGDYQLKEYDVVIWMTGYEESNTITVTDRQNLELYLQPSIIVTDNGGSLWLISQGYFKEAFFNRGDLVTFAEDYLQHNVANPTMYTGLPSLLYGNDTHPVTDYPTDYLADKPLVTMNRIGSMDQKYIRSYRWESPDPDNVALYENSTKDAYALTYDSDGVPSDPYVDSRLYIQPWEFSRIKATSAQAQYTYRVIMWLGNITQKFTRDVAISEQTVEPEVVFYKQKVTINFVIRNNGFSDYNATNTSSPDLEFLLRITDIYGKKDLVAPHYGQVDYLGTGLNNTITVPYYWVPEEVGYHRLMIKVDPYDRIKESNELNNELSDYLSSSVLNVQFRILVVDDDGSANNNGPYVDETLEVSTALERLNATGQYSFETHLVNHTEDGPAYDGEDMSLNKYNAVLWVIGEDIDPGVRPLTTNDQINITEYLEIGGCLWLIGDGLWESGDTTNTFERNYLKIASVTGDAGTPTTLNGFRDDEVSHGMRFSRSGGTDKVDALVPTAEGVSFFYQNITLGTNNSVRYEGKPMVSNETCKVATTAWMLSSFDSNESKAELVFMMLRWFDKPEDRIEARITDHDIWLSDEHPQIGSGYVIQATVHNTGGATANVLVRFMDGDTQIGSDSISVTGGETTTAEIVWIPLFAGQRTLHIFVDPIAEVVEIFEWSNNNASRDVYVYFFWDDMESGTDKWTHSSTVLLINGEEPLEYFYDTALDTNIITEWDEEMSIDINTITHTRFYHSLDTAYWLQEPEGIGAKIRKPMDIAMVIDTSGSMGWDDSGSSVPDNDPTQRMHQAKLAANAFVDMMGNQDRLSLWRFTTGSNNDPWHIMLYTYMDAAGKQTAHDLIGDPVTGVPPGLPHSGFTPIWDTIHEAIDDAYLENITSPNTVPVVLALTDGDDTSSDMDSMYFPQPPWPPYDNDGDPADDWILPVSDIGVCEAPLSVYTVGLCVPGGEFGNTGNMLNETAISSNPSGKFYYAPDPAVLEEIFEEIFDLISEQLEGENQTRSGGPIPQPLAMAYYNYTGVTQAGGPHDAWRCDVDQMPPTGANLNSKDEATNANYIDISSSDDNRWQTQDPGNWDEMFIWSDIQVAEDPVNITQIDLMIEIQGNQETDFEIWALNQVTTTWVLMATTVTVSADTDTFIITAITANFDEYIIPGTGLLQWGCYQTDSSDRVRVDYIGVVITHGPAVPTVLTTIPADGDIDVAVDQAVSVVFDGTMDTGVEPNLTQIDGFDPGNWTFTMWSTTNVVNDTATWTHNISWNLGDTITLEVDGARNLPGLLMVASYNWSFTTVAAPTPPWITYTSPVHLSTDVLVDATVVIIFSEPMNTTTINYTCSPDNLGWVEIWDSDDQLLKLIHNPFNWSTTYTIQITAGQDKYGELLVAGGIPNPWSFDTGEHGSGGGPFIPGYSPPVPNINKTAVTETFNLKNLSSAKLSFWHKYNMIAGVNGGFLQIGYNDSGTWMWKYIIPANAYTGNLRSSVMVNDSFGTRVFWCWNGISGRGAFSWENVQIELLDYVDETYRDEVKVKFNYTQYGGGTGYGWYIDDVRVTVSRADDYWSSNNTDVQDIWNHTNADAHSGNYSWANVDPVTDEVKGGIDNYLMTMPIDLTNAKIVYLSAYFKFNFNYAGGSPPDGFRVEVTIDNGITWEAISMGVRSGWNVSGTDDDDADGNASDGKAYTGLCDSGDPLVDGYWIEANTLTRVSIDLSIFSGNAIHLRFRMATCGHPGYAHNNNANQADPGFGGFYVDDVIVLGETIFT